MASFATIIREDNGLFMEKLYDEASIRAYSDASQEWRAFYTRKKMENHVVRIADIRGFGIVPEVKEAQNIPMFHTSHGYVYEAEAKKYGGGFRTSEELMDDNRYQDLGPIWSRDLGNAAMETKELEAVKPFNGGHSTYKFPDEENFFSKNHKGVGSIRLSNTLDTPAELSELTLETMEVLIRNQRLDTGRFAKLKLEAIVIPDEMKYDMERVARSKMQSGTANNDLNAFMTLNGRVPIYTNRYLTHPGRFYMKTSDKRDSCLYQRKPWMTRTTPDVVSQTFITIGSERYVFFVPSWSKWVSNGPVN